MGNCTAPAVSRPYFQDGLVVSQELSHTVLDDCSPLLFCPSEHLQGLICCVAVTFLHALLNGLTLFDDPFLLSFHYQVSDLEISTLALLGRFRTVASLTFQILTFVTEIEDFIGYTCLSVFL